MRGKNFLFAIAAILSGVAIFIAGMFIGVTSSHTDHINLVKETRQEALTRIDECIASLQKAVVIIKELQ